MKRIALLGSIAVCLTAAAPPHGVNVDMKWEMPSIVATCTYSGGQPVSGAEVKIFSPADSEKEFQAGRTDANGVFAFVPDTAGEWRFIVDDGMGHRKESTFLLPEGFRGTGDAASTVAGREEEGEVGSETTGGQVRTAMLGIAVLIIVIGLIVVVRLRT